MAFKSSNEQLTQFFVKFAHKNLTPREIAQYEREPSQYRPPLLGGRGVISCNREEWVQINSVLETEAAHGNNNPFTPSRRGAAHPLFSTMTANMFYDVFCENEYRLTSSSFLRKLKLLLQSDNLSSERAELCFHFYGGTKKDGLQKFQLLSRLNLIFHRLRALKISPDPSTTDHLKALLSQRDLDSFKSPEEFRACATRWLPGLLQAFGLFDRIAESLKWLLDPHGTNSSEPSSALSAHHIIPAPIVNMPGYAINVNQKGSFSQPSHLHTPPTHADSLSLSTATPPSTTPILTPPETPPCGRDGFYGRPAFVASSPSPPVTLNLTDSPKHPPPSPSTSRQPTAAARKATPAHSSSASSSGVPLMNPMLPQSLPPLSSVGPAECMSAPVTPSGGGRGGGWWTAGVGGGVGGVGGRPAEGGGQPFGVPPPAAGVGVGVGVVEGSVGREAPEDKIKSLQRMVCILYNELQNIKRKDASSDPSSSHPMDVPPSLSNLSGPPSPPGGEHDATSMMRSVVDMINSAPPGTFRQQLFPGGGGGEGEMGGLQALLSSPHMKQLLETAMAMHGQGQGGDGPTPSDAPHAPSQQQATDPPFDPIGQRGSAHQSSSEPMDYSIHPGGGANEWADGDGDGDGDNGGGPPPVFGPHFPSNQYGDFLADPLHEGEDPQGPRGAGWGDEMSLSPLPMQLGEGAGPPNLWDPPNIGDNWNTQNDF
ncbi:unnamed protein product [Vitrella brassicaformis CCMP3155]|uniref:Uncharacterized protein n=1 Tax=Vitrella brassicaformis (strain CCMP3155) TaxID=1169540 RepID=A0A0G4EUE7_VITBC|nr:unnamed protein product [Vitrella brassicaformis CCMP3155]|eukprot:CEM02048.1 unnamed protein product [Vitrella brassicaformis CCMP3155]